MTSTMSFCPKANYMVAAGLHHGGTEGFLGHARPDAAPARRAESAYSVLMGLDGSE